VRFRAHDTFYIRKGWLAKGVKNVAVNSSVFLGRGGKNPMDTLGIGANMVKSLRYWLQAVGLTEETTIRRREQIFTPLGKSIRLHDPWFEELGTLWLLHYRLASNKQEAPAWWWFFNNFCLNEFSRDDYVTQIDRWLRMQAEMKGRDVPVRSLEDDFDCIIHTYLARIKSKPERVDPESNIDCPLGELGLVDIADRRRKTYRKLAPAKGSLPPLVLLAVLSDQAGDEEEMRIADIQNDSCNVGKIFNLDIITLTAALYQLELLKHLKVIRTAGLDIVRFTPKRTFEDCVEMYYGGLDK
jgi:hypothetical protein